MDCKTFFSDPASVTHKQYEALRMYFLDGADAHTVAMRFGYTYRAFTSLVTDFYKKLKDDPAGGFFFVLNSPGRKISAGHDSAKQTVIDLRKKYHSVPEIKSILDGLGYQLSEKSVYGILSSEGFARLPRRSKLAKAQMEIPKLAAEKAAALSFGDESFKSSNAGILLFLPIIRHYGIDRLIARSGYPGTVEIDRFSSIMSFLALKLANRRRYSVDDTWCMDRGMGLFAGLNVLPKTAWYTSYSDRVTTEMNRRFMSGMGGLWASLGYAGETVNMDFTTIPYWGNDEHLENNFSGKRGRALSSMLAVVAQEPESGLVTYGDTTVRHDNESGVVLEFLDFYKAGVPGQEIPLRYIVFDSKFTSYENLRRLDDDGVKFITIRRRGKNMLDRIENLPEGGWKKIRVPCAGNKSRLLKVFDETVYLNGYDKEIRQITITGNGKIKPAIIITNEEGMPVEKIVLKYAQRWLVEKTISDHIQFFHLNMLSSSMVIKVDFDFTMSILAYNLYRLLARELERYENLSPQRLYEKFIMNGADIEIREKEIIVNLKKKRTLPTTLEAMARFEKIKYKWMGNKKLTIRGASYS